MRTSIEVDDELVQQAMEASGAATEKDVVEAALKAFVGAREHEKARHEARMKAREGLLGLMGKVEFDEDYVDMMRSRSIGGQ